MMCLKQAASVQDLHDALGELKAGLLYVEKGTMTESIMQFAIGRIERYLKRTEGDVENDS